jgi:hypothetical protein
MLQQVVKRRAIRPTMRVRQAQADSIGQRGVGQEVGPLHLQCLR